MGKYQHASHYLPHDAPMVLLEEVIEVGEERAHCRVQVGPDSVLAPFLTPQGELPAWFGIEMLAQTIGVWSGWHRQNTDGGDPQPGMLLGGRGYRSEQPVFPAGAQLDIRVTLLMHDDKMGSFDGTICRGDNTLASGRLTTYQPELQELQQLLSQGNLHDA